MPTKTSLTAKLREELIHTLQERFEKNRHRHGSIAWEDVLKKLTSRTTRLEPLYEMEQSGGEPDVVAYDQKKGEYIFFDCAPESPAGRRSLCYDPEALKSRKENKSKNSALGMAQAMGVELLTEEQYRHLQTLGAFDAKTSSWIQTPPAIRKLGGALFSDFRYGQVFTYHNGAESYYAARGFRACARV